jgi:hypothetical protein
MAGVVQVQLIHIPGNVFCAQINHVQLSRHNFPTKSIEMYDRAPKNDVCGNCWCQIYWSKGLSAPDSEEDIQNNSTNR